MITHGKYESSQGCVVLHLHYLFSEITFLLQTPEKIESRAKTCRQNE